MGKLMKEMVKANQDWIDFIADHTVPSTLSEGASMAKTKTKENKTARFGMRVAPETKAVWEHTAKAWGYKSTSEWLEAMANWAIQYDSVSGNYEDYLKTLNK